VGFGPTTF